MQLNPIFALLKTNFFTVEMIKDFIYNYNFYYNKINQKDSKEFNNICEYLKLYNKCYCSNCHNCINDE